MDFLTSYTARFGRLGRAAWFARLALLGLLCCACGLLAEQLVGDGGAALFALIFVWCAGALSMQRLHDSGRSGWHMLAFLVPVLGPLWLLRQLLRDGDDGANVYGDNPRVHRDYLQVDIAK